MRLADIVQGVQHLGIPVVDLNEAVNWYEEKLGFRRVQQKIVLNPNYMEMAILVLGDIMLQIYQPSGRERLEVAKRRDGILDHFAIEAPDIEECARAALEKGMQVHSSTPDGIIHYATLGENGVQGVNFVGPNQEVVELCHDNSTPYGARKGLQGWAHLALKVRNLERSREFYTTLGFKECGGGYLLTDDGRLEIAFMKNNGFMLEIIQMAGQGLLELDKRTSGHIDHIALDVSDICDALYLAKKEGFKMIHYMVKTLPILERGIRFFKVMGPDGEIIEFVEKNYLTF